MKPASTEWSADARRDLDWTPGDARALGERGLDLWCELLRTLPERPVATSWPPGDTAAIVPPIPDEPVSDDQLVELARKVLFEFATYPGHPRFMGYICGAGTVPGVVADFLAAALNANAGGFRVGPGAITIESHLTRWFATHVFGLPQGAFGLFTSGGALANLVALKAARDACIGPSVRQHGVSGASPAVYASEEAHVVIDRAVDILGMGVRCLRKLPVDGAGRMRIDALERALEQDAKAGVAPAAIVATAGTTSTGAIDPLQEIADVAARRHAWFHVDGAYGAVACLSDRLKSLFRGIERADSIAFDPQKWLSTPVGSGCVVARDPERLRRAFGVPLPPYVRQDKERTGDGIDLGLYGPEFSRPFYAFKVMFSLLAHGRRPYAESIERNVELTRYLAARVDAHPNMERMTDGKLSICCFRYVPRALRGNNEALDVLNERLVTELQVDGRAFCSGAVVGGRFVLRACIVNFRSRAQDVDALLRVVEEIGERLKSSESLPRA
jgi:glutamate/tyrosine decarboxylase-like PLP-dependent enzyme